MPHIIEIFNPFKPFEDTRRYQCAAGVSIRGWLEETYPGFKEFTRPTICIVNGEAVLRKDWHYKMREKDVVNFVVVPGDYFTLAYYIILAIVVVATVIILSNMPKPVVPGETPAPDPVYDLKGQRNQNRFNAPIEVPYGRCRLFPSYAAVSWNIYEGNQAYQYSLYSLGQGEFDLETPQYEDTPITNFQDITYEVYGPGVPSTMFPDNVVTSSEVGGLEMLGPNEPSYSIVGPFSANESGTTCTLLQVDCSFPAGLYHVKTDGSLEIDSMVGQWEYREIDNAGAPVGAGTWLVFFNLSEGMSTTTPQRFTLQIEVPAGRYEVRAYRIDDKQTDSSYGNTMRWDSLRAFLPSTVDYGNITRIAVKARATNNLNDNSAQRFNVWATRKLPIYNSSTHTWSAPTATRNPIWAFCDAFRAPYGGQLADQFLDLTGLATMAGTLATEGRNFDFVFDQPTTVWEIGQTIARSFRGTPTLNISQITIARDGLKTVPTAVFTQDNIVARSLDWEIKLANISDYDGVEIQYVDPTGWTTETVRCLIGDDVGDNLEQITLAGCTNRDLAYQEGMYIRSCRLLQRENLTFQTELEGHIPSFGDLISISHDLPKWGQSGLVKSIVGSAVTLSEPVTFDGSCVIAFRKKDGSRSGPYTCVAGADAYHITLTESVSDSFFFDSVHELPLFQFGPLTNFDKLCVVTNLQPSDDNKVTVSVTVYDPAVFDHDSDTAPDEDNGHTPHSPIVPTINCATLTAHWEPLLDGKVRVSWSPATGATKYRVDTSVDGVVYDSQGETTSLFMIVDATPGQDFYYKVTPLGIGSAMGLPCLYFIPDFRPPTPPPPLGGPPTYPDYWDPLVLYPASASYAVSCKLQGGTATLIGFSEFASPSSPPKKYLHYAMSGTITASFYATGDCSGSITGTESTTLSGTAVYDLVTGGLTDTTNAHVVDTPGSTTDTSPATKVSTCPASDCRFTWTCSATNARADNNGSACCNLAGNNETNSGSFTHALTVEDSEENAIARLEASFADWSTITGGSIGTGCSSSWAIRTTGFSFAYSKARVFITGSGYSDTWAYTMIFDLMERDAGSSDPFTKVGEISVDLPTTSGAIDTYFDVPQSRGKERYVTNAVFE
jgi:hypothetical protein